MTEDEMVGWHHRLSGHEFEQTPGDSGGLRSLACRGPWGCRVTQDLANEQQELECSNSYTVSLFGMILKKGFLQFSHSVLSDSLRPHELQHARPPCPSPTPGVYSNSCPDRKSVV